MAIQNKPENMDKSHMVDCPECDGSGTDEEGNDCEHCQGSGVVEAE